MGPNPNGPLSKLQELLDTQVFSGSVQWVLLEISWMLIEEFWAKQVDMVNVLYVFTWMGSMNSHSYLNWCCWGILFTVLIDS